MTQRYAHLSRGHLASNMATFEATIPVKPGLPTLGVAPGLHQAPLLDHEATRKVL